MKVLNGSVSMWPFDHAFSTGFPTKPNGVIAAGVLLRYIFIDRATFCSLAITYFSTHTLPMLCIHC